MTAHLLVVEDDPALLSILEASISFGGFTNQAARGGHEAIAMFKGGRFDGILMDLGLPDVDGGDLLKTFRGMSNVPIIVVSGRGSERDKIEALDMGADDFVAKPFLPGELLARIRAALRRHASIDDLPQGGGETGSEASDRQPIHAGILTLDPFDRTAKIGGGEVSLTEAEYKLLKVLATNANTIVSRATLLEALYGEEVRETHIVEVLISYVRRKLRPLLDGEDLIVNRRGQGWILRTPR
jgi:two-component system KDP operon response regulator KdpE